MSAEDKEQTEIEKEKKQQRPVPTPRKRQPQSRKQEVLVTGDKRQDSTVTCDTAEQTSDEEEYLAVTFGHTNNDDTELERVETVGEEEIDPGDRLAEDDRNAIRDAQPEGSPERAPRRSQRARRPPRWHDTYNMSQISKSPGSSDRSDAIKALVHTGALSGMSLDIVDKVEFTSTKFVTGIATKGRTVDNPLQWVTKYSVFYSLDGTTWSPVNDSSGEVKIFAGNTDRDTLVQHRFGCPIPSFLAKFVRITPIEWVGHISMRFGVTGCDYAIQKKTIGDTLAV
ncbi:hypothetical protein ScPMuIL_015274 [Solemya velum]